MHKLYLGLLILGSFLSNLALGQKRAGEVESLQIVSHPNQYIENHKFDRYVILVAVDRTDPESQKFIDHRLPEIVSLLKNKNIPYEIQHIEQEVLQEYKDDHAKVISELKEANNIPKAVASQFDDGGAEPMGRLRRYWRKIYVPATSEAIERGLLYGSLLQAGITAATGYFLESKGALELSGQVGIVALFGGLLGAYNETLRNFLKMPDHSFTNLMKSMGISGTFAVPMKLVSEAGRNSLATIAGCAKILEHCFLSQVAKVYLQRILIFREKYGYLSSKKAFYWSQVGMYGAYLFLRICHLNDVPFLSYGFYAMGPIGFLAYLGYQSNLTAVVRNSKRFYTLSDVESGRLILTEVSKSFEQQFLKKHPNLAQLNASIEHRSFRNMKFNSYFLGVVTSIFMDEVKSISKAVGTAAASGFQACGRVFSMIPFRNVFL